MMAQFSRRSSLYLILVVAFFILLLWNASVQAAGKEKETQTATLSRYPYKPIVLNYGQAQHVKPRVNSGIGSTDTSPTTVTSYSTGHVYSPRSLSPSDGTLEHDKKIKAQAYRSYNYKDNSPKEREVKSKFQSSPKKNRQSGSTLFVNFGPPGPLLDGRDPPQYYSSYRGPYKYLQASGKNPLFSFVNHLATIPGSMTFVDRHDPSSPINIQLYGYFVPLDDTVEGTGAYFEIKHHYPASNLPYPQPTPISSAALEPEVSGSVVPMPTTPKFEGAKKIIPALGSPKSDTTSTSGRSPRKSDESIHTYGTSNEGRSEFSSLYGTTSTRSYGSSPLKKKSTASTVVTSSRRLIVGEGESPRDFVTSWGPYEVTSEGKLKSIEFDLQFLLDTPPRNPFPLKKELLDSETRSFCIFDRNGDSGRPLEIFYTPNIPEGLLLSPARLKDDFIISEEDRQKLQKLVGKNVHSSSPIPTLSGRKPSAFSGFLSLNREEEGTPSESHSLLSRVSDQRSLTPKNFPKNHPQQHQRSASFISSSKTPLSTVSLESLIGTSKNGDLQRESKSEALTIGASGTRPISLSSPWNNFPEPLSEIPRSKFQDGKSPTYYFFVDGPLVLKGEFFVFDKSVQMGSMPGDPIRKSFKDQEVYGHFIVSEDPEQNLVYKLTSTPAPTSLSFPNIGQKKVLSPSIRASIPVSARFSRHSSGNEVELQELTAPLRTGITPTAQSTLKSPPSKLPESEYKLQDSPPPTSYRMVFYPYIYSPDPQTFIYSPEAIDYGEPGTPFKQIGTDKPFSGKVFALFITSDQSPETRLCLIDKVPKPGRSQ